MSQSSYLEPVVDRLQTALEGKLFPSEWQQWGSRLLDHLRKPVQVAVLGQPGYGKSTLINMMLAQPVIPRVEGIPVIEVAHGPKTRTLFELEDGGCVRRSGLLTDQAVPEGTIRARLELEEDILLRQNFIEVGLTGTLSHQMSMVNWVVQWADIILWCTDSFDESEQKLWAGVPDDIKDHSFLVLTMADRQMMRGVLQERIAALEPIVAEEFLCLYPIATEQAITARSAGPKVNQQLWAQSGGKALLDGVLSQVESGRNADMDQAQMLLNRFAPNLPATPRAKPSVVAPAAPSVQAGDAKTGEEMLTEALQFLQDRANEMLATFSRQDMPESERILESCVSTAEELANMLHRIDPSELVVQDIVNDAQESAEMMLLFQLEKDEDAAVDAVTLLLQLKKEIARKAPVPAAGVGFGNGAANAGQ